MNLKKIIPYAVAILLFIIASILYFNPVLSGKQIKQSDITQFSGMAKEVIDYRDSNNKEPYWLNNAFSGMPAYQVSAFYPNDFMMYIDKALRFLPRPADYLFLYFLGFFFLLSALKVNWKLAILGSFSFGFSTYLIIIFGAGHNAKAHAIAYMPMVIAGILYIFQQRYLLGFLITALAMALEIFSNHPQMTYYLGFCLLILGIIEGIEAFKNKTLPVFAKQSAVIIAAVILGIGVNAPRLLAMKEYSNYSNRGKSELTINPDGSKKERSSGLNKEYITEYSYGKLETFNLLVPRYMGGGTVEKLSKNSDFYKTLEQNAGKNVAEDYANQALTYWGTQPIVEAPAYIGAIIIFLFFLGLFLLEDNFKVTGIFILGNIILPFLPSALSGQILFVLLLIFLLIFFKNKTVKWIFASITLSILLSWGKNLSFLTDLFINYVPLYNKFRAVSSIQVIAELCIPLLGVLALKEFFSSKVTSEEKTKALKKGLVTSVGIIIIGFFLAHIFSTFEGIRDNNYKQLPALIDALISDRKSMLLIDSLRSIILITLASSFLWLFIKNKLKKEFVLVALTVLILFDLISVDIRYVNKEDFVSARKIKVPFTPTEADKQILEDTSYYRVANFTSDFMNEARTSYFHKSIGGYHAAKMKRYQELFSFHINQKKMNPEILNMLNTKYLIVGADQAQLNSDANGNAWFIENIKIAESANNEIQLLDSINTKKSAIIHKKASLEKTNYKLNETATIKLKEYSPNKLTYETQTKKPQFAVFSEIYYKDGWNAYIDGVLHPHYQTNYVLRGMEVPSGKHNIEFKFEPRAIKIGSIISLLSYILLLLIPIGWFFLNKRK